jgi:hypothetical protein
LLAAGPSFAQQDPFAGQTFLSSYAALKEIPSKSGKEYTYIKPGAEDGLGKYKSVMIDQPEIHISPASPAQGAKPDDVKAISEMIRSTMGESVKARGYQVVAQPGPGTLFVRLAATDLQIAKKKKGLFSYTPVGMVVGAGSSAMKDFMEKHDVLDISLQAEFLDSVSNEVLGASVLKRGKGGAAAGGKAERLSFEQVVKDIDEGGQRVACRLDNGRKPVAQRVDCTDPAARAPNK